MKYLKLLISGLLISTTPIIAQQEITVYEQPASNMNYTNRISSDYATYSSPAEFIAAQPTSRESFLLNNLDKNDSGTYSWCRDIFRFVDVNQVENSVLFNDIETNFGNINFFSLIFNLLKTNKITAYKIDSNTGLRQLVDFKEILNNYNIPYLYNIDNTVSIKESDIPKYVLSYCIKERWFFDTRNNKGGVKIMSICPIFSRHENQNLPLYWVNFSDIAPYIERASVISSTDKNKINASFYDYLTLRRYKGLVYQVDNNNLYQLFPDYQTLTMQQQKLDRELKDIEIHFRNFK